MDDKIVAGYCVGMSLEKRNIPEYLVPQGDSCVLSVRAQPGARRTAIVGPYGAALKVAVRAPPDKGRANQAIGEFLAEVLGLARSRITLISGQTSHDKRFRIDGVTAEEAARILDIPETNG